MMKTYAIKERMLQMKLLQMLFRGITVDECVVKRQLLLLEGIYMSTDRYSLYFKRNSPFNQYF